MGQELRMSDLRFLDILPASDRRYPINGLRCSHLSSDCLIGYLSWREVCARGSQIYLAGQGLRSQSAEWVLRLEFRPSLQRTRSMPEYPVFNILKGLVKITEGGRNFLNHPTGSFTLSRVMPGWDNTARRQQHGAVIHPTANLRRWSSRSSSNPPAPRPCVGFHHSE